MGRLIKILPKSCVLGVDLLIFITVGMSEFPFNRLLEWVDDLCRKMTITEEVFAQTGHSTYRPKYYKSEAFLTREENIKYMENLIL